MLKGAVLLLGSGTGARVIQVAKKAIIARVVSVEDFGIIATFAVATGLMQMLSDFALDRLVVQHRHGGEARFIAALQLMQILRGVLGGIALFLLAGPYARLMGVEDLIWPYQALALVPLITGFISLDLYRPQREGRFGAYARWQMIPPIASVAILGGLLMVFDDWRIGLFMAILSQLVSMVASHLMAERPMRVALDLPYMREALAFGWPLMLNAVVLFAVLNGDRIIVSNQLGLEQLAYFTVALAMAQILVSVVAKAHQYVFLSELSRHRDDAAGFVGAARLALQSRMALAIGLALSLALIGPDITMLVYGEKYAAAGGLVIVAGLYFAMRTLKGAPNTIAVSRAQTTNPFLSNLPRLATLPVAYFALTQGADLVVLILIATFGEFVGYLVSLWLLRHNHGAVPPGTARATLLTLGVFALIGLDLYAAPPQPALFASFHPAQLGLVAAALGAVLSMGTLRAWLWRRLRARLGR